MRIITAPASGGGFVAWVEINGQPIEVERGRLQAIFDFARRHGCAEPTVFTRPPEKLGRVVGP